MEHKLDFITRENVIQAISQIENGIIPKDNEWSEYWINFQNKLYQFKYVVEVASSFTKTPIETTDFTSNDSSRNYIAGLGFHILFKSPKSFNDRINYWVGASYFGLHSETNMINDFVKNKYWRTDHNLKEGEGLKILNVLQKVHNNDRICIRFLDKKGSTVQIAEIGTITDISGIQQGRLGVIWDYNPPKYKGQKPAGTGSGNWWKTLFQLKKQSDISTIFSNNLIEKRVARLTWNYFGWVMPSGPLGKSETSDSHEARFGYGHEEWLLDTNKLIDGFHYGFLEPVRKGINTYSDKTFDVWLFSIDGVTKKRFWIGEIKGLIVINKEEAESIKEKYLQYGWIEEMIKQIKESGANKEGFSNYKGVELFNVKFKPKDIFINDPYFELPSNHPINEQSRYSFIHFKNEFEVGLDKTEPDFKFNTSEDDGGDDKNPQTKVHFRQPKAVEIYLLHRAISNSLTKSLRKNFGKDNVTREHPAGYGAAKIDIVLRQSEKLTFYEIKTYNSIRTSVREAIGQLLEYCFYPDKQKAVELIVVTQLPPDSKTKAYFMHLRKILNINLYYQSYDMETKSLSEKY